VIATTVDPAENLSGSSKVGCSVARLHRLLALAACVVLLVAGCAGPPGDSAEATSGSPAAATSGAPSTPAALKTIDPAAFQAVVESAAAKLLVPGAMVVLRTPQGTFRAAVGTTELASPSHSF
jgi:D-alanyl-D-alanine carboxypeptidase